MALSLAPAVSAAPTDGGVDTMLAPSPDVLVDPSFDERTRRALLEQAVAAQAALEAALGARRGPVPLTIFCNGERSDCAPAFAGTNRVSKSLAVGVPARGASWTPTRKAVVVLVEPTTDVRVFTIHEQAHVEFFHRLGGVEVPHWFAEGVSVVLSGQRCKTSAPGLDDLSRVTTVEDWSRFTADGDVSERLYCQAGEEVAARLKRPAPDGGEPTSLATMIDQLASRTPFAEVFGPLATSRPRVDALLASADEVGRDDRPFTIALFVRPRTNDGTLALLSSTSIGTGACTSLLGFDGERRLLAQWFGGGGPDRSFFPVARGPVLKPGRWVHVAMTWRPGGELSLYVDGALSSSVAAPKGVRHARRGEAFLTWGSLNVAGTGYCWTGHVEPRPFDGLMADQRVLLQALAANEIAALAARRP